MRRPSISLFLLLLLPAVIFPKVRTIDHFETASGWKTVSSQGVEIKVSTERGTKGNCLRIDYNFTGGTGYCGIEKIVDMDIPGNYRFDFFIRGNSPRNNLEFKLIDRSGDNVWWRNQRNFEFSESWEQQSIKKRQVEFAWGPSADKVLRHAYKLQFVIASFNGGKGTVFIDELTYQDRPVSELVSDKPDFRENPEMYYIAKAKAARRGIYPRYFNEEGSFWNIIGADGDRKESLINEDGMLETDKGRFSIEPFIYMDSKLLTWNESKNIACLEDGMLPMPIVIRQYNDIEMRIEPFAAGEAGESVLYSNYKITNTGTSAKKMVLFLTVRPFQVNPYYQFLNEPGGTAKIRKISYDGNIITADRKSVILLNSPDSFGAAEYSRGDITDYISKGRVPKGRSVSDKQGFASAAAGYSLEIPPGQSREISIAVPFYDDGKTAEHVRSLSQRTEYLASLKEEVKAGWQKKLKGVNIDVPDSRKKILNTLRSNICYVLINRDSSGIQPGSRSYERSWIRDGAMTSSTLLKFGFTTEVRQFIDWYSQYLFDNGKVPCVVDRRGADPVDENDSNGEYIFLLAEYLRFTHDTAYVMSKYGQIQKAVSYIDYMTSLRKTDYYKNGNDSLQALYGLVPESISHEGYSAKPMHSYWDDFWILRGLKDAVYIARAAGRIDDAEAFAAKRDEFKQDLYNSISKSIVNHKIDYIPGAAELGDFDATSTAIAIYPAGELANLPRPQLKNTFDRYYAYFRDRADGRLQWDGYTPYELRTIGAFIYMDEPVRAGEMLDYFFRDQRPVNWNHWAEVVWRNPRKAGFIGDMPHTWVGSDYISSVRSMFVFENEEDTSLVIGAGISDRWFEGGNTVSVRDMKTWYGDISYTYVKEKSGYSIKIDGSEALRKNPRIYIRGAAEPGRAKINGRYVPVTADSTSKGIPVTVLPAEVAVEIDEK
ncbi:MAG: discoidin domain-containing protein [Bacteroidota bacterium]